MTYLEKIKTISNRIHLFGGTTITFGDCNFAFGQTAFGEHLELHSITYDGRTGFTTPDMKQAYYFPLRHFSESFLCSLFHTYLAQCKNQLTEKAYMEVLKDLGLV